ncbi:MAG: tRNA (guanosine(46)-N7)-methyltransferase TrmB [Treponema sp.]|jgi:tRNA (guanine-N7-)-methyltransferase|nr:tRNA (guanosine(46)-N7)-methyltransferase TrmB [Treponema sp.]
MQSTGIRSYVIRSSRGTDAQRRARETLCVPWCVELPAEGFLEWADVFTGVNAGSPVVAEIGFGMGAATAQIAGENPGTNYLGIEVHKPGIGHLLLEIKQRELKNVKIIEGDAVEIFERHIKPASLAGIHIFFPDPWPKTRHHKRRLVTRPFTETLARALEPGGYVYMITDWQDYAKWALAELSATHGIRNTAGEGGFCAPQALRPKTKFEEKALRAGRGIWELRFVKD